MRSDKDLVISRAILTINQCLEEEKVLAKLRANITPSSEDMLLLQLRDSLRAFEHVELRRS